MRLGPTLQKHHRQKHGADAAGGICKGEEVREVEAANHREMLWPGRLLLHGRQYTCQGYRVTDNR
jgi:hypothetical protein